MNTFTWGQSSWWHHGRRQPATPRLPWGCSGICAMCHVCVCVCERERERERRRQKVSLCMCMVNWFVWASYIHPCLLSMQNLCVIHVCKFFWCSTEFCGHICSIVNKHIKTFALKRIKKNTHTQTHKNLYQARLSTCAPAACSLSELLGHTGTNKLILCIQYDEVETAEDTQLHTDKAFCVRKLKICLHIGEHMCFYMHAWYASKHDKMYVQMRGKITEIGAIWLPAQGCCDFRTGKTHTSRYTLLLSRWNA